ncbi:MAG: hypothetical protein DRJ37_00585 [Thermoprotei archaeon]|nr:MAG: hypothetical protein DRJ37_00585 [Thermoprotei archaeon]
MSFADRIAKKINQLNLGRAFFIVLITGSLLVMGGILYVIVNNPPPLYGEGPFAYGLNRQSSVEAFVVAFAYAVGIGGLYLLYTTRRYYYDLRFLSINLISGTLLLLLSLLLLQSIYAMKVGA